MSEQKITVCMQVKDQNVGEELRNIIASFDRLKISDDGGPAQEDLLILEIGSDLNKEFHYIQTLKDSGKVKVVFLTSTRTEPEILLKALRCGAREFFPQPIKKEEVEVSFKRFINQHEKDRAYAPKRKKGKVINVIGSKGGVGATTVAVNLASGLKDSRGGRSVALMDMNLLFGEVPMFLGFEPVFNWGEIAKNITRLDSTYLMSVLVKHQSGMYVLPSPTRLDGVSMASPEIIEKIIGLMKSEFDYIVIDSGQSLDDISLKVLSLSDTVLLVSILSLPCLINVKRLLETFWSLGYPHDEIINVIINRYHKKSVISVKEAEKAIKKKIPWLIPNDYSTTISAINQGKLLSVIGRDSEISKSFHALSKDLVANDEKKHFRINVGSLPDAFMARDDLKNERGGFFGWKFIGRKA